MQKTHYDLRDVRAVCVLSRVKGFREAAEVLAITPSALSRRVAKLEEAIGGLLVKRNTHSMALTPLGRRLVSRCQPALDALDDSIDELSRMARGMEGQITVGCISSASYALLAPVVARFRASHPNLRIHMRESDGASITAAVLDHQIDFGLTTVADRHDKQLLVESVAYDPFVLVCGKAHPFARKRSLTWTQIVSERLMGYKSSSNVRQSMDRQLAREGIELNWFDEVETLSSLIGYLGTGNFVGVVPRLMAAQMSAVARIPLTGPKLQRELFLVRRKDSELTPPAHDLWADVRRTVLSSVR